MSLLRRDVGHGRAAVAGVVVHGQVAADVHLRAEIQTVDDAGGERTQRAVPVHHSLGVQEDLVDVQADAGVLGRQGQVHDLHLARRRVDAAGVQGIRHSLWRGPVLCGQFHRSSPLSFSARAAG